MATNPAYFLLLLAIIICRECSSKEFYMSVTWGRMEPVPATHHGAGHYTFAARPTKRGSGLQFTARILCSIEEPLNLDGGSFMYIKSEYGPDTGNDDATQKLFFQIMRNVKFTYSLDNLDNYIELPETITETIPETVKDFSNLNLLQEYTIGYADGADAILKAEFTDENQECLKIRITITRKTKCCNPGGQPMILGQQTQEGNMGSQTKPAIGGNRDAVLTKQKQYYMNITREPKPEPNSTAHEPGNESSSSSSDARPRHHHKGKSFAARILCSVEKPKDSNQPSMMNIISSYDPNIGNDDETQTQVFQIMSDVINNGVNRAANYVTLPTVITEVEFDHPVEDPSSLNLLQEYTIVYIEGVNALEKATISGSQTNCIQIPVVILERIKIHPRTQQATYAWHELQASNPVTRVNHINPTGPTPSGHLRFVFISDTHSADARIPKIPDGDVLIHAGDFTDHGTLDEVISFNEFLGTLPHKHKLVIAGNHDHCSDPDHLMPGQVMDIAPDEVRGRLKNCTYLENQSVSILGITIYGTPWQPKFKGAFNLERGAECRAKWEDIPLNTDILVTHSPPVGHGDQVNHAHYGCVELLEMVKRIEPICHVFGHIHEGYGVYENSSSDTTFINASTVKRKTDVMELYEPTNPPIVFDVKIPTGPRRNSLGRWFKKTFCCFGDSN